MINLKISIIVPVYNGEKYLCECVESIINQTYKNLEIILLDDGSKDNSGKICDEYAKSDNRIRVIHKENTGVSDTRNKGIEAAKGDYIGFVDSDDYIKEDMFEFLINNAEKFNADISVCGTLDENSNHNFIKQNEDIFNNATLLENDEIIKFFLNGYYSSYIIWDKIYRTDVIKNLKMNTTMKIAEDTEFLYKSLKNSKKVIIENKAKCFHRYSENSAFHMKSRRDSDLINCAKTVLEGEINNSNVLFELSNYYLRGLLTNCKSMIKDNLREKLSLKTIKNNIKPYKNAIKKAPGVFNKHISLALKIKKFFVVNLPYIYILLLK